MPIWLAGIVVALVALTACSGAEQPTETADQQPTRAAQPSAPAPITSEESDEPSAAETRSTDGARDTGAAPRPAQRKPLRGLAKRLIADGLSQPVLVTGAPGSARLYVVEREGTIRTVNNGTVAQRPFLDLRDRLLSSSIEQGLLGLAFHPDFETNRRAFAYWTDQNGDSRLGEFRARGPGRANPGSMKMILEVDQPAERHNAGNLAFGPDGLLYVALGDGGTGGSTAQDTSSLLGSILRIDVDARRPYAIPEDNPFGNEIWVYGLRNPWRFSIDPADQRMYIGDVGQEAFEEINVVALEDGAGTNFGWALMEGRRCFRANCDRQGLTRPVLQYSHGQGCSVTGGRVYRGTAIPELRGHYFYADWCTGLVRSFRLNANGRPVDRTDWTDELSLGQVTSFGVDNRGELLAVNWDGQLFRIVPRR